jgi:hypothetical protein
MEYLGENFFFHFFSGVSVNKMALTKKQLEMITGVLGVLALVSFGMFVKTYYPKKVNNMVMETKEETDSRMKMRKIYGALAAILIVGSGVALSQGLKTPQYYYF